jgi:hypothetical protein
VLSGEVTYEAHPAVFDDDALLFSIWRLEREDPEWLLAQFDNVRWPLESLETIVGALGRLGDEAGSRMAKTGTREPSRVNASRAAWRLAHTCLTPCA